MSSDFSGSSPLARGLRSVDRVARHEVRIIPARAGFTSYADSCTASITDHPRSRGVYRHAEVHHRRVEGSSPLARGLHRPELDRVPVGRIIPARAGFTAIIAGTGVLLGDHPRSRGVYRAVAECAVWTDGSSPLARGLRTEEYNRRSGRRIIPARAGFTPVRIPTSFTDADHPRSRGVYFPEQVGCVAAVGSSPLARGLHSMKSGAHVKARIIPARAGFTALIALAFCWDKDHPRSRGVYSFSHLSDRHRQGSSPLARGLPNPDHGVLTLAGIIPARAGFTDATTPIQFTVPDHPRSRGVYSLGALQTPAPQGSSPLARGLRRRFPPSSSWPRIIPARAGFTVLSRCPLQRRGDHPRSRGVYGSTMM